MSLDFLDICMCTKSVFVSRNILMTALQVYLDFDLKLGGVPRLKS